MQLSLHQCYIARMGDGSGRPGWLQQGGLCQKLDYFLFKDDCLDTKEIQMQALGFVLMSPFTEIFLWLILPCILINMYLSVARCTKEGFCMEYHIFLNSPIKLLALNKSTLLTMAKFTSIATANCILVGICSSNSDSSEKKKKKDKLSNVHKNEQK